MATVINGILSRKLPWTLVLLGVALVIVVELLGVRSLTFAVGAYLSIATTLAIFVGGVMRWMVDSVMHRHAARQAASTTMPLLRFGTPIAKHGSPSIRTSIPPTPPTPTPAAAPSSTPSPPETYPRIRSLPRQPLRLRSHRRGRYRRPPRRLRSNSTKPHGALHLRRFSDHNPLHNDWVSVVMFALLAYSLYYFARKPLNTKR